MHCENIAWGHIEEASTGFGFDNEFYPQGSLRPISLYQSITAKYIIIIVSYIMAAKMLERE